MTGRNLLETASTANDAASQNEKPREPKRPFWRKKRFGVPAAFVLFVVGAYLFSFRAVPLSVTPEELGLPTDAPLTADGKSVDLRKMFNDAQLAWAKPLEENGFRDVLAAFGPLALEQKRLAETVPWAEFPTNPGSRDWFAGEWTRLCEAFELDPNAEPKFLRRLDLCSTLRRDGIVGTEPTPEPGALGGGWLGGVEVPARVSETDAEACRDALRARPWTADEFPVAARWVDANADLYAVYKAALTKPKFASVHCVGDEPLAFLNLLLPDVQHFREIARLLQIRANYRIGKGDVAGALEDQRLIFLLSRRLLENPNSCLVEYLVGVAIFGTGLDCDVAGNPDAPPTPENWARVDEIWRETFADFDFDAARERAFEGERRLLYLGCSLDLATAISEGSFAEALQNLGGTSETSGVEKRALNWSAKVRFDPNVYLRRAIENWNENMAGRGPKSREATAPRRATTRRSRSAELADRMNGLLLPAVGAFRKALRRANCAANLAALRTAILRFEAENGTLPPAFSVDANGSPLLSWRVLILPYLGPEAAALYERFRLDEPWDSPHNLPLAAEIPDVFRCPSARLEDDKTSYAAIVGPDSLFDKSGVGKDLREIAAETAAATGCRDPLERFLVVERTQAVVWTRPDAELDEAVAFENGIAGAENGALDGLGAAHSGGLNCARANGCVGFLSADVERFSADAAKKENENPAPGLDFLIFGREIEPPTEPLTPEAE